ncbi:hypothetical protein JOB18_009741 [Solea senegalensis]|uniref:Uncharacterized protein n=1 Tax=Solea senegalensis TaxID=28829 RepID=A0AAV6PDN5_SOLSE|nr:hypothetical protein JOB18_009741 [Solea senegalensis]
MRMPPVLGVNVLLRGQRCADELILGMSRGAWRQRDRVHGCSGTCGQWWAGSDVNSVDFTVSGIRVTSVTSHRFEQRLFLDNK